MLDAMSANVSNGAGAGDVDDARLTERMTEAMHRYLPSDDLLFLMQLSVPPMRRVLAR